mgnify:CR=1 FL=1
MKGTSDQKNVTTDYVMERYVAFAERAKTVNSLILETEDKNLENEFDELLREVVSLIYGISDINKNK